MKFALAVHGTRGDVEPCAAVGVELRRRGHEVRLAAPPNLLGFVDAVGLRALAYGPDSQQQVEEEIFQNFWKLQNPLGKVTAGLEYMTRGWAEMSATLAELSAGCDLILTGQTYQGVAANVAEYRNVPLAALHYFPQRLNSYIYSFLPGPANRALIASVDWAYWRITKRAEDAQRRALGLPPTRKSSVRRMSENQTLEIQAYDEVFFPGLVAEWNGRRPFVGALTLELPSDSDDEVTAWIAGGEPPIYFGFGSMHLKSSTETITMISEICSALGERALVCAGDNDVDPRAWGDRVKVVHDVNHAAIFPLCRACVHHGGPGTLAAGMRAGIPTLVLWVAADQPVWAAQVKHLRVGLARRLSATTAETLLSDLRKILEPRYVERSREIAARMTTATAAATAAADLLEHAARRN